MKTTTIEHHDDGSHTIRHTHDDGTVETKGVADLKGLKDSMNDSLGNKQYMMRHGDTDANDDKIFDGWSAWPLNEAGRKQVEESAKKLQGKGIKAIVTSDIVRAKQSAEIAGKILGVPVIEDHGLASIDTGVFTNKKKADHWKEFSKSIADPNKEIPGGESPNEFTKRIKKTVAKYHGPILFVTHNSGIIAATDTHYSPDEDVNEDIVPPGGVMEVGNGKHKTI